MTSETWLVIFRPVLMIPNYIVSGVYQTSKLRETTGVSEPSVILSSIKRSLSFGNTSQVHIILRCYLEVDYMI